MATFFHGNSEIQGGGGDGLQTLILMNPAAYVAYSDSQPPPQPVGDGGNFVFLNSNSAGNSVSFSHAPPLSQPQHFVGVPLQGGASAASSQDPSHHHQQHVSAAVHGFFPCENSSLYSQPIGIPVAREVARPHQGLSLSLSSQQLTGYGSQFGLGREVIPSLPRGDEVRVSGGSPSPVSGLSGAGVLFGSKYLKAAQELLDEVVKIGKTYGGQPKKTGESSSAAAVAGGDDRQSGGEGGEKRGPELSTTERQEIQMKKAKLVNMLDKVEQRYREYHHQMQIVISWFEQAAGIGSAKTYTALALQTISEQFRCLKDAILGHIRAASKSIGEGDDSGAKIEGSKLKYVDSQIRQQRALQQLGMIQHNAAWRPQRGLPERSVSVLRAWLFEHFLHPYPKDSDKIMLAKQTGLTRSQVSNWFINARVRLWKPMVEEMYMEEIKEQESSKSEQNEDSTAPQEQNPAIGNQNNYVSAGVRNYNVGFHLIGSSEMGNISTPQKSLKKARNIDMSSHSLGSIVSMNMESEATAAEGNDQHMSMKFGNIMGEPTTNFIGSYPISELGRFGAGEQFQAPSYSSTANAVSLTLGLPRCENASMTGAHQEFLPHHHQSMQLGSGSNNFSGMTLNHCE